MSGKLSKFLAKPIEVTIDKEQYMIKPFTVGDLPLLNQLDNKDDEIKVKALKKVIFKVMKQIDNDATEEIVDEISIEFLEDIMNAVSKVNNLDIDDAKKKLLKK